MNRKSRTATCHVLAAATIVASTLTSLVALEPDVAAQEQRTKNYSPYVDLSYPTHVYWGETHLHTAYSPDAGLVGDDLAPDEALRLARGEQLRSSTGAGTAGTAL
jgi:Protein of unknown function (DUF3604)